MHSGSELLLNYQLNGAYECLMYFRKLMCFFLPASVLLGSGFTSNTWGVAVLVKECSDTSYHN